MDGLELNATFYSLTKAPEKSAANFRNAILEKHLLYVNGKKIMEKTIFSRNFWLSQNPSPYMMLYVRKTIRY